MTTTKQDAERRFAQIEGERDYYKRQSELARRDYECMNNFREAIDTLIGECQS